MAKAKQQASKTPKKRSTKYSKLAAVCSKELAAKKKALVLAEKRLAKAQKTHTDLLSEVARLDMLDRSLRAVNEGLEPPQNVKYVYTYPQWVWNPYPNQWWYPTYTYPGTYTVTLGATNLQTTPTVYNNGGVTLGNIQATSGQFNCTTTGVNAVNTVTTTGCSDYNSSSGLISNDSGISGQLLTCSNSGGLAWQSAPALSGGDTVSFTNSVPATVTSTADLVVDLSTGATADGECDGYCEPACEKCAVEAEPVGHGG
jgi:hypothetical protein